MQFLTMQGQIHIEMKKINVDSLQEILPNLEGIERINALNKLSLALCCDFPDSSMALQNGIPKYATAFNQGNSFQSWRDNVTKTGVIFDLETNEVIAENLAMPHSPRLFGDELYVLLSATGELIKVDIKSGKYNVIVQLEGFVRGMSLHKDYLFVGLSKLRKNSSTFGKLDFAEKANQSGIMVIHLPTGSIAGKITYLNSLDEIYDVHVLPDKIRPNILNTITDDYKSGLMTPKTTFWAKSKD